MTSLEGNDVIRAEVATDLASFVVCVGRLSVHGGNNRQPDLVVCLRQVSSGFVRRLSKDAKDAAVQPSRGEAYLMPRITVKMFGKGATSRYRQCRTSAAGDPGSLTRTGAVAVVSFSSEST